MGKEIHLYLNSHYPQDTCTNLIDTQSVINIYNKQDEGIINTTQTCVINTKRFEDGYRLFVHFNDNDFTEIVLGDNNERTDREIKMEHNLEKLILSGEFN